VHGQSFGAAVRLQQSIGDLSFGGRQSQPGDFIKKLLLFGR